MKKYFLLPILALILLPLAGQKIKNEENGIKMKEEKPVIQFENAVAVSGATRETVPSDALFAEKGKHVTLGDLPWNLESYTGKETEGSVLVRATVTVPQDGWYTLKAGADWWLSVWVDGVKQMDAQGDCPPSLYDHTARVNLKAGKHTVDFNFSRGTASAKMVLQMEWYGKELRFGADLTQTEGKLNKYLHGANTTLILSSRALNKYDEPLRKLNFTLARTHDWPLWNAGQRIIDTHFIFPMMKLDPKDPTNYFFDATDEIIRLTQEEGKMEVFYRLGTSIEHTGDPHFNIIPPADPEKYAEVLAGIVRHYTKGWAKGFHYNIRYWEIWNEPDGIKNMWPAPYEETFIPFFVTVLKRLKTEFPDLQFGGPAMGGIKREKFLPLLKACKEAGIAPDFISWHRYGMDAETAVREPAVMRRFLDELGFNKTKICINEWHYIESWTGVQSFATPEEYSKAHEKLHGINSGVYNLAVLCGWQYGPLDLAMWYGASWDSPSWGYRDVYKQYTKNYYSLELYGRFLKDYTEKCPVDNLNSVTFLAGKSADGQKAGVLIADMKGDLTELKVPVKGIEKYSKVSAVILDETRNNESVPVTVQDGSVILKKAKTGSAAFLVSLESNRMPERSGADIHVVESAPGYQSWPMIAAKDGRLICIYSCGKSHNIWEPFRKTCACYSDDGGIHWSKASELVNSEGCGDVPIGKGIDENGDVLFWVRCTGKSDFRHELYRTSDGRSFERIAVFRGNPVPVQITDIFKVPGVGLMALWFSGEYSQTACHNSWGTLVSSDNGRTWVQQTVEKELSRKEWPTEPSAVYLGSGRILAIARSEILGKDQCQFQMQSMDYGLTWMRTRTNIADVAQSSPSLVYDGKTGTVSAYYYQRGAGFLKRRVVKTENVWDHPLCWPEPEIVCSGSKAWEHAGNVNVCLWKDCHAAAFYSGDKDRTSVIAVILPDPANSRK